MDILQQAKELKLGMEAALDKVPVSSDVKEAAHKLSIVNEIVRRLIHVERGYSFTSGDEMMTYYREWRPLFYASHFFYTRIVQWTTAVEFREEDDIRPYYNEQLSELEGEFNSENALYHYFQSGASHLDEHYFLSGTVREDGRGYDVCKGKMIALLQLREVLFMKLKREPTVQMDTALQWKSTRTELTELLYALYVSGAFGKATLKKIIDVFSNLLNVDLKNYSQLIVNIKMRKESSQTFFLNALSTSMQERLDKEE